MMVAGLCGLAANAQPRRSEIPLLEIEGVINPLTARYLERGLDEAKEQKAGAVIVRLDTPGGTMDSMRQMTRDIMQSPVPVIVYVAPDGARAASAGMFITVAGHVAAMSPGTNLGSAHPVAFGRGGEQDAVMEQKAVNDAAAMVRAIARTRGRNAEWLESAVRKSVAITGAEALELRVIDILARDFDALLAELDGRTVTTVSGEHVLRTAGATLKHRPMNLAERILHTITDPNVAYILFTLGLIGLAAELYNPGMIFPGVVGGIFLILAFVAFGSLPINWGGLVLIGIGLALFIGDLLSAGIGFLAVGGAIAFLLGSLMLYRPIHPIAPSMPDVALSPWLAAGMAALLFGFLGLTLRGIMRARRAPVRTGIEALMGRSGLAVSKLAPYGRGIVRLEDETWTATAEGEAISPGERIRVVGVEGVTLRVRKENESHD